MTLQHCMNTLRQSQIIGLQPIGRLWPTNSLSKNRLIMSDIWIGAMIRNLITARLLFLISLGWITGFVPDQATGTEPSDVVQSDQNISLSDRSMCSFRVKTDSCFYVRCRCLLLSDWSSGKLPRTREDPGAVTGSLPSQISGCFLKSKGCSMYN